MVIAMADQDVIVTSHDSLGNDYVRSLNKTPVTGNYVPYGLAGVVAGSEVFCCECASDDELRDDEGDESTIFGDAEFNYPGAICDNCGERLDTYVLVSRSQDPELWYRVKMMEEQRHDSLPTIEQIAKEAEREAYNFGWEQSGSMVENRYENTDELPMNCPPTDSAKYANMVLPNLRAIAGYVDSAEKGTFTECPNDDAHAIFNEGVMEKYRAGYIDRMIEGREHQYE